MSTRRKPDGYEGYTAPQYAMRTFNIMDWFQRVWDMEMIKIPVDKSMKRRLGLGILIAITVVGLSQYPTPVT